MAQTTVKSEQIATNAISGTIIADNAITGVHIAQNAILTQHIDDGQVGTSQLAADAVTGAKLADSSVVTANIQDDQVTGDKLANNITIAGTLASTGVLTANAGVVIDNFTIDGTEIDLSSGDLTLDVAGDIYIDADGGDIVFKDGGTDFGEFSSASNHLNIKSSISDADIKFKGNDGGSTITALTLDMSAAGKAIFNNDIALGDTQKAVFGNAEDLQIYHDASNSYITNDYGVLYIDQRVNDGNLILRCDDGSGGLAEYISIDGGSGNVHLKGNYGTTKLSTSSSGVTVTGNIANASGDMMIDVAGNIQLDADDAGEVRFIDGGTTYATIKKDGNNALFQSIVADGDFIIQGIDGSSFVSAVTFDMSAGGDATFNGNITIPADGTIASASGDITLDAPDDIFLDADGGNIRFKDAGTTHYHFSNAGNSLGHTFFADSGSNQGSMNFTFQTDGSADGHSITNIIMRQGSGDGAARKGEMLFQVSDNGAPATSWLLYNNGNAFLKYFNIDSAQFYPQTDNSLNLGHPSYRYDDIYATNNTIQTSDSREKTALTALTTNEINASKALAKEFGTYKWLSAVSEKGSNARTHIGITAQKVKEIMETNSLDPTKYAFYCYDEWDATEEETITTEEGGKEVIKPAKVAGNRYGIRYSELYAFIVAGFNARLTAGGL